MDMRGPKARSSRPWERLPHGFWRGFISGAFALLIIGGLLAFLLSPEILKHRSAFPLEEALGQSRIDAAIDGSYKDKTNPVAATPENLTAGKTVYNSNCAFCHGVTGQGDADIGKNMFPQAANLLDKTTVEKTDGELLWILENGLGFVGMPAFKSTLSQDDLWKATLYIRQLQKGTAASIGSGQPTAAAATPASTQTAAVAIVPTTAAPPTAAATTAASSTNTTAVASSTIAATASGNSDLARGLALFQQEGCVSCHGGDKATGGLGPALNDITFPFSGLLRQVRSGSGVMPAFPPNQLSDSEAMLIYNYLKSLQK
jgi:mono/diheme cytochrome c family protein